MKLRLPTLVLGLSALGACASVPAPPADMRPTASAADAHRITVTETAARLEVPVYAGTSGLSPESRQNLRGFADAYLRAGHGMLILSTPAGGANAEAAAIATNEARLTLTEAGVSFAAIASSSYEPGQDNSPILVTFARFEAQAPECRPLWEQDLAHQSNNQPWESFGCATQANLAAIIEDPRDLLNPRNEDPRDNDRRLAVIEGYREGTRTHSERSNDERVSISNAVQ